MENNNDNNGSPTRVPVVRGAYLHPIIELQLEYEDHVSQDDDVIILRPDELVEITVEMVPCDGSNPAPPELRSSGPSDASVRRETLSAVAEEIGSRLAVLSKADRLELISLLLDELQAEGDSDWRAPWIEELRRREAVPCYVPAGEVFSKYRKSS